MLNKFGGLADLPQRVGAAAEGRKPSLIRAFLKDRSGATAIEYGMIAVTLIGALLITLLAIKDELVYVFDTLKDAYVTANS